MSNTKTSSKPRSKIVNVILLLFGIVLIGVGVLLAVFSIWKPEVLDETYYETKDKMSSVVQDIQKTIEEDESGSGWGTFSEESGWSWLPGTVWLGGTSQQQNIDDCDGTFTLMESYPDNVPPWWSAHNGCGGNTLLKLEVGHLVNVKTDGVWEVWEVKEYRDIPQLNSTTSDVEGISGEMILQTCYWDNTTMKVIGLSQVK